MSTEIKNNVFYGVHWDADAIKTVQTVATALLNLTELFKSQNIQIDSFLKINEQNVNQNEKII